MDKQSEFHLDDGGRAAAGFKGKTGDCVTRAIAIATRRPYRDVYDALHVMQKSNAVVQRRRITKRVARVGRCVCQELRDEVAERIGRRVSTSPRNGISRSVIRAYLKAAGWAWTPTMRIGSGRRVHLHADELPAGRLIVNCSKHLVAVIDGVIQDTYDCARDGTRCVYGYWTDARS